MTCAPLYGTPRRPEFATLGPEVEAFSRMMTTTRAGGVGRPFMPMQSEVWDTSQEYELVDGRIRRRYRTVVVIVPRQAGKTTGVEAHLTWESHRAIDTTSLYMAQAQNYAGDRIIEMADKRLGRSPIFRNRFRAIRSNGRQRIIWPNGSLIATSANNDEAGHGLTINGSVVVDEAFAHADLTSINALSPTQVTCWDPQLWIVSTLGDGTDGLLQHYQDVGAASLHDPDTDICYFEWAAPPGLPVDDPATWWLAHPALGHTIDERTLRSELVRIGPAEFDRAYLCRRRTESFSSRIDPQVWARQLEPDAVPGAPLVLSAEVAHDRSAASVCAVGPGADGRLVGVIDRRPGTSWIAAALRDLQVARRPAAIAADDRGPIGSMIARLELDVGPIMQPSTVEFGQSAGDLIDALAGDELVHVGQADLDRAAAQARHRPLGDLWAWDRRRTLEQADTDASPLCALTLGLWAHRRMFPNAGRGRITP